MEQRHEPGREVAVEQRHESVREAAVERSRGDVAAQEEDDVPFCCDYCRAVLPSQRSLGQHIRNNHAAQASIDRDRLQLLGLV